MLPGQVSWPGSGSTGGFVLHVVQAASQSDFIADLLAVHACRKCGSAAEDKAA